MGFCGYAPEPSDSITTRKFLEQASSYKGIRYTIESLNKLLVDLSYRRRGCGVD
jgi:hypothetical protein